MKSAVKKKDSPIEDGNEQWNQPEISDDSLQMSPMREGTKIGIGPTSPTKKKKKKGSDELVELQDIDKSNEWSYQ